MNNSYDFIRANLDKDSSHYNDIIKIISDVEVKERKYQEDRMPFGKFKGKTYKEIFDFDPGYLEYVEKQDYTRKNKHAYDSICKFVPSTK